MGMYDEIQCKVELPIELPNDHREHWFQTKSLDRHLDFYQIRENGTLWHEEYDIEDRSDPNAEDLLGLADA